MIQDRASWKVKDSAVLSELIALMNLSSDEQALLGQLQGPAATGAPQMSEVFYARLLQHEHTREYLAGKDLQRLHTMVGTWFIELFSGTYDEEYVQKRLNIGRIHVQIGLPVRYPLAMLDVILPFGEQVARQSAEPERAVSAFRKVFALDVAIFNQAYEDNQLKHLSDLVGGERLARLLLTGGGA